jgi:hypothetical protein
VQLLVRIVPCMALLTRLLHELLDLNLQGTNAHVIMCHMDGSSASAAASTDTPWHRRRLWFAPPPHVLLQRALVTARGVVQLATQLGRAQLAYLWDHQVHSIGDFSVALSRFRRRTWAAAACCWQCCHASCNPPAYVQDRSTLGPGCSASH